MLARKTAPLEIPQEVKGSETRNGWSVSTAYRMASFALKHIIKDAKALS